jgi:O-antigen/teichoic acid export membrane protein
VTTSPSIKKNYALNALVTFVNLAYPFATFAYLARIIGPGYLGKYYFASSLVAYFLFAASFGIPMYGAREIGRRRGDPAGLGKVFAELSLLNAFASLAATAAILATVAAVPEFRRDWPLFLILGAMVPLNALSLDFLFLGQENQAHIARRTLASKLAALAALFLLVREAGDYLWYAAITTGALLLHNLAALPAVRRAWPGSLAGLRPARHLRPVAFLFLTVLSANVYLNLDSVLLGLAADEREVGYYNAAVRLCRVAAVLLTAIGVTLLPRLARLVEEGREDEYRALLAKSFGFLCLLAVPASLILAIASPGLVRLFYGEAFAPAAATLQIAAPLVALTGITSFLGSQVMLPKSGEKPLFLCSLAGAAASPALILLLAPSWGASGAAWAAVGAEGSVLVAQLAWARARAGFRFAAEAGAWKFVAAGTAMAAILSVFRLATDLGPAALAAALAASCAAYAGLLLALGEPLAREMTTMAAARIRRAPGGGGPPGRPPC